MNKNRQLVILLKVAAVVGMPTVVVLLMYRFFTQQLYIPLGGLSIFLILCSIYVYFCFIEGDKR